MHNRERPIKALGEIALRITDLGTMQRFYEEIVGLELMRRADNAVFFKIADGYGGHTQVLALFDRSSSPGYWVLNAATSTVDHIAFEIALADYQPEKARLESLGQTVTTAEHAWVHWRSLYVTDPEGNQIEWVCYDESVL
jgi:catechol 2,3-dioxygenase